MNLPLFANVINANPQNFRNQAFAPSASNRPTFVLSSRPALIGAAALKAAGNKATGTRDRLIDACENDWADWYGLEWGNGSSGAGPDHAEDQGSSRQMI